MWNNYKYNYNTPSPYQPLQTSGNSFPSYQQSQVGNSQMQNNLIWVMGKENARSMQLQPNSAVVMLDSEANKFYIKTTDDIGLGRLRVFNYTEQNDTEPTSSSMDLSNYVTREELEKVISTLKQGVNNEQSLSTTESTHTKR